MTNYPPVFIVGTGRCGSTLMSEVVARHPNILSLSEVFTSFTTRALYNRRLKSSDFIKMLHEPAPTLKTAMTPESAPSEFTYKFNEGSKYSLEDLPTCMRMILPRFSDTPDELYDIMLEEVRGWSEGSLADWYVRWFGWLRDHHDKSLWIERTGTSITMVKALARMFPDAKFVHIYRDGRETALSIRNFRPIRIFLHIRNRLRLVGVDILKTPFRQSDSWLIYHTSPFMERVTPAERFMNKEPTIKQSGQFWSDMLKVGMKDLEQVPKDRQHNMNYADLVREPRETLSNFLDFVAPGIPKDAWLDDVSKLPRYREPAWKNLSNTDHKILEEACRPGMELLGLDYT